MNDSASHLPQVFKGIALFTPGGDVVYCIDAQKQARWHLHLCAVLQELLHLVEPPHFLLPCYTATLDTWIDRRTQQLCQWAEVYPPVCKYGSLLNALFGLDEIDWQPVFQPEEFCNPLVIESYRSKFPALWESHNLVFQVVVPDSPHLAAYASSSYPPVDIAQKPSGFVFRLYIAGQDAQTAAVLGNLHQLLDQTMRSPYTLKVVDVNKHPEQAEADHISATPTLIRVWPRPTKRIVGSLNAFSNLENLAQILTQTRDS
ncbi:circadian clock KaiB family protein [Almyronema epifaneia]|uniref:Circadian clock KaiB family protein n=1 Tax=Almyronema epifaneia S1 TaxID=2991925 RepID=A0ABW6IG77_9CYAN